MVKVLRRSSVLLAALIVTTATADHALAAGDDGVISGGGGPDPRAAQLVEQHSWVAPGPLRFGTAPYAQVRAAATAAAGSAACEVSPAEATDLTLSPTWPEVAPSGNAPSPMTLSRYDDQPSLSDPKQRSEALYFNPGVGAWQLDSAGLGADITAAEAIDVSAAADQVAPHVVDRYCAAINSGASAASARAEAWRAWRACGTGACEDVFQRLRGGALVQVDDVGRYGGAERRVCGFEGVRYDCLYVDPGRAQGDNAWTVPHYGPAPVPAPFYAFTYAENGREYEVRYWAKADSGAVSDVSVSRELGVDARDRLSWSAEPGLCDLTAGRGRCRT
ncbi:hypothetical protein [Saccharopolyspora griseoalba]|uniref:Uncharacterized protein n=1 Tax=Saccharopolyspora griseoalba TaxID=1431848 RepID=A0ABW2LHV2_9PSEU